jgi:hypothetical protein
LLDLVTWENVIGPAGLLDVDLERHGCDHGCGDRSDRTGGRDEARACNYRVVVAEDAERGGGAAGERVEDGGRGIDAPAVLGWTRWTEIGNRYNTGLVRTLLTSAIETGRIPPQPVEATALTMLGAMREATLYVALAERRDRARQEAGAVITRLIDALGGAG